MRHEQTSDHPAAAVCSRVIGWRRWLAVGGLFAALTLLATWPQVLHLGTGVRDPGDPLFNSWVLAWNAHKLGSGEIAGYFDANIFHPHRRTLAYSEHLFPQSLLAAPVIWAGGNPVLAHNVILLLSLFTSALAMFALARRLTGATLPAILAGVIFAFCPFMFDHLSHVQVVGAAGFPLSFLFLDRFLEHRRRRDVLLFAAVFTAQILANGYYALFLSLAVAVFLLIELPRRRLLREVRVWRSLALAGILSAAVAAPFFRQYVLMQRELGFSRCVMDGTTLGSYLAAPRINRLYGTVSAPLRTPEGQLFPGATAMLLAVIGAVAFVRRSGRVRAAEVGLAAAAGLAVLSAGGVVWLGPISLPPLLSVSSPVQPAILAALALAGAALVRACRQPRESFSPAGVYAALGLLAFTLTFGNRGPYRLLYKWVPGFDSVRAVNRVHMLTMLAVAVLAAFGAAALMGGRRRAPQFGLFAVAAGLVAVEYASTPLPLVRVALDGETSRAYRWIDRVAGERDAILELPFPRDGHEWWRLECPRLLFSTLHWRPLVNGFSGLAPPVYHELQRRWREHALTDNVADARTLGARYVLVHRQRDGQPWPAGVALASALRKVPGVRLVQAFPATWVFELEGSAWPPEVVGGQVLSRVPGLRLSATVNSEEALLAADGRPDTRWSTGRAQERGDAFTIALSEERLVGEVRLRLGDSQNDYPRGWTLTVSSDGVTWSEAASGRLDSLPITAFLTPTDPRLEFLFPPAPARFIRVTCTTADPVYYWSIHELEVFAVK